MQEGHCQESNMGRGDANDQYNDGDDNDHYNYDYGNDFVKNVELESFWNL